MDTTNAITQSGLDAEISGDSPVAPNSDALHRAHLYHFFELALAHPGEEGHDYFRREATETEFLETYAALAKSDDALLVDGLTSAQRFFARLRDQSYEQVEASHIGLFSANYPHLPCPPYGSIFTAMDSEKRLEEMLAIKCFYQRNGVDIADSFDDLPDHLCVELEFSQLMCFREDAVAYKEDPEVLLGIRGMQTEFLDRFLLPLGGNLVKLARASMPENLYCSLLETLRCFLLLHRRELGPIAEPA